MKIKNWHKFQHFKDRRPPWIKLHRDILDQRDIMTISDRSFRVLVCCWLLASEDEKMAGNLPPIPDISWRLRISEKDLTKAFQELKEYLICDDINMISDCHHVDAPETETETETKKRQRQNIDQFGDFWQAYPRKVNKPGALKAWQNKKLNESIDIILAGLERWKGSRQWIKDNGQYIPHPATWLNQERWNDDPDPAKDEEQRKIDADIEGLY